MMRTACHKEEWLDLDVLPDIRHEPVMRPLPSILDPSFRYVPSDATSVEATWRRAGWRPTTEDERRARQRSSAKHMLDDIGIGDLRCRRAGCALGRALEAA
jgi:hypothetical protein